MNLAMPLFKSVEMAIFEIKTWISFSCIVYINYCTKTSIREYNIQEKEEITIPVAIGTIKLKEVNQLFEIF